MAVPDERPVGRPRHVRPADEPAGFAPEFDRQPPQDLAAEQSVLGGMLLSKDAIADVVEVLRPDDFYRPAHQTVFDCVLDLYGRGEPADPVTVSAELERRGELVRLGGAPYLHTLIATVPTAANAGYYAEIVAEKAILRRLVEAGTRIVQLGYLGAANAAGSTVDEVVDRAQAAIYDVTERRASEDYVPLEELLQPTMDEIDAIASRGGVSLGVPTGFIDLDAATNGLHPGQMIVVAARPGLGKALALDTPLPTPTGWTTMGAVAVGDELLAADGTPTRVVATSEVMLDRPCYDVVFSDGSVVTADAEHQWLTRSRAQCRAAGPSVRTTAVRTTAVRTTAVPTTAVRTTAVRTTAEIAATVRGSATGQPDHSVAAGLPLVLAERALPVEPYPLGVCLGGGGSGGGSGHAPADPAIIRYLQRDGHRVRGLGRLPTRGGPRIPPMYLRASRRQRRALLAGLLDAGGTVTSAGATRIRLAGHLAVDVHELAVSLGYVVHRVNPVHRAGTVHRVNPAHRADTGRRVDAESDSIMDLTGPSVNSAARDITEVRPVRSVPVRCVQVDHEDQLYLAGRSMIPTHNSTLGLDFARSCSVKHGMTSAIFSLEMSRSEIVMRLLSAEARIRLTDMRAGRMSDDDWTRMARRMSEISEAPLFIDDSPNLTMMEIRAKARRMRQRHDLKLVVVDYLQLMTSGKRVESRQQEVSEFSRQMKLLAKELEVPVVAISQLNRGPEQRTDKRPMLADLRESGCLSAGTRLLRADTGAEVTLKELVDSGERGVRLWSLDERMRMVAREMTAAFPSGTKEVFALRLRSGREVQASANHPFLTVDGWCALGELTAGDRIAAPRRVPAPLAPTVLPDDHVVQLAELIGEVSSGRGQPLCHAGTHDVNLAAVTDVAKAFGPRGHPTFVPAEVFGLADEQVALFLRHLWAAGGAVGWDEEVGVGRVHYSSSSRRLVEDVSRLLLRFGVLSRVKRITRSGYRGRWSLHVTGSAQQRAFVQLVGVHGGRGEAAATVARRRTGIAADTDLDTVPREVCGEVRSLLSARRMTHRSVAAAMGSRFCGSAFGASSRWKHAPSRSRLARAEVLLHDAGWEMLATNDVFWDEIVEVTSLGEQPVYDATVPGTHNFVADGVMVHNSIEQDADMVILLHRPDAFERDDPRAGEADLILAKHRNGPTNTITVAHQLHYSRFADLAR